MAVAAPVPTDVGVGAPTIATMAREWAKRAPRQVAIREKDLAVWHERIDLP